MKTHSAYGDRELIPIEFLRVYVGKSKRKWTVYKTDFWTKSFKAFQDKGGEIYFTLIPVQSFRTKHEAIHFAWEYADKIKPSPQWVEVSSTSRMIE